MVIVFIQEVETVSSIVFCIGEVREEHLYVYQCFAILSATLVVHRFLYA